MYILNLRRGHEQAVDSIQVLRVEETDLNLASTVRGLQDLDLCAERSSQLRLRGFDVGIDRLRRRASRRFLLSRLLHQLLSGSYRQPTVDDLPRETSLEIGAVERQDCSSVTGGEAAFLDEPLHIVRQSKQT